MKSSFKMIASAFCLLAYDLYALGLSSVNYFVRWFVCLYVSRIRTTLKVIGSVFTKCLEQVDFLTISCQGDYLDPNPVLFYFI